MSFSRAVAVVAALSLLLSLQIPVSAAQQAPRWDARSDTGAFGDDVARFVAASPTLNMVNQGLDTVFITGNSSKSAPARAAGLTDLDVGTTAYDANTGAVRWKSSYDGGLGVSDRIGAFEVNYHNNLIYEMVNSGNNLVTIERSVRDGKLDSSATYPGAIANDSAISGTGGFLGVVGSKGGDFNVLTYQTGVPTLELDVQPVAGEAFGADIAHDGSLATTRTLLVTGQSSGFGTRGDVYTVAYDYRTGAKLWDDSWASPDSRADEGLVAESAHVSALGKGVAYVAGRTFSPDTGWDILISAYDLATGGPLWGPIRFDGEASGDDTPTHLSYSDATSTLFLAGTSERGVPHGQDVLVLALDGTTGAERGIAYASGDSSNADDAPTGLTVSKDGKAVYVAADVHNLLSSGSQEAALFAYNSRLAPAGSALMGGAGDDRSAGVAMNVAQNRLFLAGSSRSDTTGFDHRVASFAADGFEIPAVEVPTALSFTDASDERGHYSDSATLEARLVDEEGVPLAEQPVVIKLGTEEQTVTTDAGGLAATTFELTAAPGAYPATATFEGAGEYLASETDAQFTIEREDVTLEFTSASTPEADHTDSAGFEVVLTDDAGAPLAERAVTVTLGQQTHTLVTDAQGKAATSFEATMAPGSHPVTASFGGDELYIADDAAGTLQVTQEDTATTLAVSGRGSSHTLVATLRDADAPGGPVTGRNVSFYSGTRLLGTVATNDQGIAELQVRSRGGGGNRATYRASFSGDEFFLPSQAEASVTRGGGGR